MRFLRRHRIAAPILIAVLLTGLSWAGLSGDVFFGTQLRLSDALYPSNVTDTRIVVVGIDDRSLAAVGRWPWPRDVHASILDRLTEEGAALVGYDVTFAEPSEDLEADRALAEAVASAGNVILAANASFEGRPGDILTATELALPIPELAAGAAAVGHSNVFPDPDGVVRAVPPVIETPSGELLGSLSLELMALASGEAGEPVTIRPDGVQIGGRLVPTGPVHLMDVNFAEGYETYSAIDLLEGLTPPGAFEGRIVLIGATAIGLGDQKLTPLDKADGQPGVFVHASALNTMLTGRYVIPEGTGPTLAWVFLLGLLVALAVTYLRPWLSPVVTVALLVAYGWVGFTRFDGGTVMNLVYPPLAAVLGFVSALAVRYVTEFRERQRVTATFGRYLARDVVEEVLAAPEGAVATLKGAARPLAVLFADLRGFTAASEGADPEDVVAALNQYLDAMCRAVVEERGTIDKFMGDCVMAFWGAPRPDPEYAVRAVRAAVRMQDYLDEAMASADAAKLRVKGCGVGVSAGDAVVGNIGSAVRLDYTVIGDTVNTASRICGVADAGQIVITEECARLLEDRFPLGPLPPLVVKGKALPLRVFEVLRKGRVGRTVVAGEVLDATEEKGHFEPRIPVEEDGVVRAPSKAAGYAPVEPVPDPSREPSREPSSSEDRR
ncbi:MAG: adenylate/guanylate cyclase domain-containing protein [Actinobacteria bacterium]|nr:adenylate/guanylate cyclase domain-containing protein [Actinomycetota bacterium]